MRKYAVYNKSNYLVGRFNKKANAEKVYKKPSSKMLVSLKKSEKSFSGWTINKVLKRK